VLRSISKIKDGKVFYEGKRGTNISASVVECHQRIQNFIRKKGFDSSGKKYLTSVFVITDGEPSAGILDTNLLREKINEKRNEGNTAIKGIYIKPKGEESISMEQFFGLNEFVETEDFDNAIERFIQAMSATYIQQGRKLKQSKKISMEETVDQLQNLGLVTREKIENEIIDSVFAPKNYDIII